MPRTLSVLLLRASVALALVAPLAPLGRAETVEQANLGDTVSGTIVAGVKEVIPIHVAEGTLLDVDLKMAPGSNPGFSLLNPDRTPYGNLSPYSSTDSRLSRRKAKKIPLVQSGRHYLVLEPGTPGDYSVTIKGKPLTKGGFEGVIIFDPTTEIPVGGVPGGLLTVVAKRGKASALVPSIHFILGPDGEPIDLGRATKHTISDSAEGYTNVPMDDLGTYILGVGTRGGLPGDLGKVQWKVKFPRVKGTKRGDADLVVDPLVDEVTPPTGFDNLAYEALSITGDFFGPGPAVRLEGATQVIQATNVLRAGDTTLFFDLDLRGKETGRYDLVVTLPNGGEGRLPGGFTVSETPIPVSLSPSAGFDNQNRASTLSGSRFQPGMAVTLAPQSGAPGIAAVVGSVNPDTADLTLPLQDAPLGLYDVIAINPDGGTNVQTGVFTVNRAPRLTNATPLLGQDNDAARVLALSGLSFQADLTCNIERTGQPPLGAILTGLTANAVTATFDLRGAASGAWTLRVTNPDGGTAVLGVPFVISRAPRVQVVNPSRGFDTESLAGVVVSGTDFVAGAQATLERAGVATVAFTGEVVGAPGTTVTGDLALSGIASGAHDLRVTNPDAGKDVLTGAFNVLGRADLVSGHTSAGRPHLAWNPDRSEYLAVYAVSDGSQRDIRARRFDVVTGAQAGAEIVLTSGPEDQFDPSAAWSPYLAKYLVVYTWNDPNASGQQTKVLAQFVDGDGTLNTDEENAYPVGGRDSGTVSPPRVVWNPDRKQWLLAWAFSREDVLGLVLDEGQVFGGALVPGEVFRGVLVATSRVVGEDTVHDWDYDPDIAYSSSATDYIVTYSFDTLEVSPGPPAPPPADTGIDVRAAIFDSDFSAGPNRLATLTNLGATSGKDEIRSRTAFSAATSRYIVAWEFLDGSGGKDLRCFLVESAARTRVGTTATTLDQTGSDVCSDLAVAFDPTTGSNQWLVAWAVSAGTASTSRIEMARIPPSAPAPSGLGTPVYRTLAGALSGEGFQGPAVAVRGVAGEFLAAWQAAGTAKPGVNAELRFAK